MTRILNHVRSNLIAYTALFVALGGTSYGAISLPANSVGTQQLRNGAVTSRKLAKHSVTASSLDPKSIAGHIADWARIRAGGLVVSSNPHATVSATDPHRGLIRVSWGRSIPPSCVEIANPSDVTPLGSATASTAGPIGRGRSTFLVVETFDGSGANVPENVNVVVICQ